MAYSAEALEKLLQGLVEERHQVEQRTRELHAAMKDAKQVLKELRKELDELAKDHVEKLIEKHVVSQVEVMTEAILKAQDQAVEKTFKEFDKLRDAIFFGGSGRDRGENLTDQVLKARGIRKDDTDD